MIKTSIWQWIFEMVILVTMNSFIFLVYGRNKIFDRYLIVINILFAIILNSFYLLGDSKFQRQYHTLGCRKALMNAVFQSS